MKIALLLVVASLVVGQKPLRQDNFPDVPQPEWQEEAAIEQLSGLPLEREAPPSAPPQSKPLRSDPVSRWIITGLATLMLIGTFWVFRQNAENRRSGMRESSENWWAGVFIIAVAVALVTATIWLWTGISRT